jgi:hypothetical protein
LRRIWIKKDFLCVFWRLRRSNNTKPRKIIDRLNKVKPMTNGHEYDECAKYQIRVRGELGSSWSDWFDGFSITVEGNETALIGVVTDQSALHGILAKINDLGLPLISVNKLSEAESDVDLVWKDIS